jgi:5-methylcytosine-specific restriction endonuclease McrA
MPDVRPDPKPVSEGGIGRKKPPRGWRTRGRKMATREEWTTLRAAKLGPCRICETLVGPMEFHHLVPRSQGGDDVADNLVPLCAACHGGVTRRFQPDRFDLAANLTDGEYAYIVGKLGPDALWRLFGVRP